MKLPRMKFLLLALLALLTSCYDAMEVDTSNLDKVEIPISIKMPLANGSFIMPLDSLVDMDEYDDIISYENGIAYFVYDTVVEFYDELDDFFAMEDLDFSNPTLFDQGYDLIDDLPDVEYSYQEELAFETEDGPVMVNVDTTLFFNPQDTFRTEYGSNAVFTDTLDFPGYSLEIVSEGEPIDLGIDFDLYRVDMSSGIVHLSLSHSELQHITDEFFTIDHSFDYHYSGVDTTLSAAYSIPIYKGYAELPEGVFIKMIISIPSLISIATDMAFYEEYIFSSMDTAVSVDLADYYFQSDGSGEMDLDVSSTIEIESPKDRAVVPLPDTLFFHAHIEDFVYSHAVFNYGTDTVSDDSETVEIDVFDDIPDDIEIEGFRLAQPELKIAVLSNIGFPALLEVSSLQFSTSDGDELITDDGIVSLQVPLPVDPLDEAAYVQSVKDSMVLNADNSRFDDIELLTVDGLSLDYRVVVNSNDEAGLPGKHNFFYDYAEAYQEDMYELQFSAELKVPFEFRIDKVSFTEIIANELATDEIDSIVYLGEEDSLLLELTLWTKDFPFNANAQVYLEALDDDGELYHIDSLFAVPELVLPSSNDGVFDSVMWQVVIDATMYDHILATDSITFDISFSMDEDDYFLLKEKATTEVAYKFNLGESSFVIKSEDESEE